MVWAQDSLGGNSRTLMIVTACPTILTSEESHFTLQVCAFDLSLFAAMLHARLTAHFQFATRVRRIQLAVATRNVNNKNIEETLKAVRYEQAGRGQDIDMISHTNVVV